MKNNWKSLLCLLLVLAGLLCACGKDADDESNPFSYDYDQEEIDEDYTYDQDDEIDEDYTYDQDDEIDEDYTYDQDDESKPAATEEDKVYSGGTSILGELEDNTYTNTYVGLQVIFPEDWVVQDAYDLQDFSEAVEEVVAETDVGVAVDGLDQATVMMASDSMGNSVNIVLQHNKLNAMMKNFTEEQVIDSQITVKDQLIKAYEQMGMEVSDISKVQVDFLGEKHYALLTEASIYGVPMYMLQLMNYSEGDYAIIITVGSMWSDNTATILEYLQPLG